MVISDSKVTHCHPSPGVRASPGQSRAIFVTTFEIIHQLLLRFLAFDILRLAPDSDARFSPIRLSTVTTTLPTVLKCRSLSLSPYNTLESRCIIASAAKSGLDAPSRRARRPPSSIMVAHTKHGAWQVIGTRCFDVCLMLVTAAPSSLLEVHELTDRVLSVLGQSLRTRHFLPPLPPAPVYGRNGCRSALQLRRAPRPRTSCAPHLGPSRAIPFAQDDFNTSGFGGDPCSNKASPIANPHGKVVPAVVREPPVHRANPLCHSIRFTERAVGRQISCPLAPVLSFGEQHED